MFPLSPHAKDCYIMPAASLQVGTEAGSQRGSTDPAVWTRLAFGSAELWGILRFDRQSASPSSLRLWKLGRYRIDSCYLHVPAISRSFWKGKQGLPFVSPQSRTWCVTKLTCCKTDPQDSTSRTLFRRSVLSCLFFSGHSFHRVNASGFIASRLWDVSSEFFSSVAAAVQFSQTWVTV